MALTGTMLPIGEDQLSFAPMEQHNDKAAEKGDALFVCYNAVHDIVDASKCQDLCHQNED